MFRYIEPEVSGNLGKDTVLDNSIHPPIVSKLDYEFDGWLGNDIIECFPCYIVTERLKQALEQQNLSGLNFSEMQVTKSDTFKELYPKKELPPFFWIIVKGIAGEDDFGIAEDHRLVLSDKAYNLIGKFDISEIETEEFRL